MIYVGSLKYSPVYKSHCCAFGRACEEAGHSVRYLFSKKYEWMLAPALKEKTYFIGDTIDIPSMIGDTSNPVNMRQIIQLFSKESPSFVYLHNYHLLNHNIARNCKKHSGKFIYHAHEPFVEDKSAHGGFQQYWLNLNEYMEARLLRSTDKAIISSKEALRLFNSAYPWFNGEKIEIPLMYEDLGNDHGDSEQRKYITFVGPPVPAKGPDIFLEIVDYAAKCHPEWSFLMVSRNNITDHKYLNRKNLSIFHKQRISDEDYGRIMQRSYAVITPYKRETQSSVILVSYMYGTPVVSSNVGGLPEFVKYGSTGYAVDLSASVEEWISAIYNCIKNQKTMTPSCRQYFTDNFSGKNWHKYLDILLT